MLEDESVIDDEEVFSAFPSNTCFVPLSVESTVRSSSSTQPTHHVNRDVNIQQMLTFEGGSLV